jgi:hypothetical protein
MAVFGTQFIGQNGRLPILSGALYVIFRQFPLASHARAGGLRPARPRPRDCKVAFWEMHDLLYGSQPLWTRTNRVQDLFDQFVKSFIRSSWAKKPR